MIRNACLAAIVLLSASCLIELDGDPGYVWCIEATGANGTRSASGANVNILRSGDWVSACWGFCEPQHTILTQGEDGDYGLEHPLYPQWQTLRTSILDYGVAVCEGRVDELETAGGAIDFDEPDDVTCATAVSTQEPQFWKKYDLWFPDGECDMAGSETGSATTGPSDTTSGGGAVGPEIYGLTSYNQVRSCTTNTSAKTITCNVDQEFVRYLADNHTLLWQDDVTMVEASVGSVAGWKFSTCGSRSLTYALGFRLNDVITKVDTAPVADYAESLDVFARFGNPLFSGSPVTAKFYRGTVLWTFTANRVDLTTYP
jgi:hypothetical protein